MVTLSCFRISFLALQEWTRVTFFFWLLRNTRHTVGIHNICAWFNSKNCLFVCGWLREHITPVILCKDLPACLFSPPSIFPSPLHRVTENTVARCLGAQSGTTPAKGENGWRRGGGEKGGPVYAVVARHKGPPPTLAPLKISVGTADRTTNTPSILLPTPPQCCLWLQQNKFASAFFGRQKNPEDCVPVLSRSREVKWES